MWEQYIAGFFGAGFGVFVLEWVKEWRSESRRRRIVYLEEQLTKLYGPLHFFISQNEQFLECNRNVLEAYRGFFEGKNWAEEAIESVDKDAMKTIELANVYVEKIKDNNRQIMELLKRNWHLIDIDDTQTFAAFQVHFTRGELEFERGPKGQIPFNIRLALGDVHFYHSDWTKRVKEKWVQKRQELGRGA